MNTSYYDYITPLSNSSIFSVTSTSQIDSIQTAPPALRPPSTIISKTDLSTSIQSYEALLRAVKSFRNALASLSSAANGLAHSLETCARCKGSGSSADGLLKSSGIHFLIANHHQILSETIYRDIELPLIDGLDYYRSVIQERDDKFRADMETKSTNLRLKETEYLRLSKKKHRNLALFRRELMELTRQIDDLERLKSDYLYGALNLAESTWSRVLDRSSVLVRAEVEIYEGIARKGWRGGGMDDLMIRGHNPFEVPDVTPERDSQEILGILPTSPVLSAYPGDHCIGVTQAISKKDHESDKGSIFSHVPKTRSTEPSPKFEVSRDGEVDYNSLHVEEEDCDRDTMILSDEGKILSDKDEVLFDKGDQGALQNEVPLDTPIVKEDATAIDVFIKEESSCHNV